MKDLGTVDLAVGQTIDVQGVGGAGVSRCGSLTLDRDS